MGNIFAIFGKISEKKGRTGINPALPFIQN
jgi:hypothetical protein